MLTAVTVLSSSYCGTVAACLFACYSFLVSCPCVLSTPACLVQGILGYAVTVAGVVLYSEAKRHSKSDSQAGGKGSPVKGIPGTLNGMQPTPVPSVSAGRDAES